MTYAESIIRRIDRQRDELRALLVAADAARGEPVHVHAGEWSSNEVLLHLIGATGDVTSALTRALNESSPTIVSEQAGGQYLPRPGEASVEQLLAVLLTQLAEIADAVRDLDDEALRRPLTLTGGAQTIEAPVGLFVRNAIGEHFDEHVAQLRQAVARTHGAHSEPQPRT